MKYLQRFMAVILVMAFLAVPAGSAAAPADEPELTETEEYQKLVAFGIMSEADEDISYYSEVTRGLFVNYLMRCYRGITSPIDVSALESRFSDVNYSGEERDAIVLAEHLGFVNGTGGGLFLPEDSITTAEMAKLLMTVLGYDEICNASGGYPSGYLTKVRQMGIFNGCNFSAEGYVSPVGLTRILMNLLESEYLDLAGISYENGNVTKIYNRNRDKNFLNYAFDIYETTGILTSNEYTSINGVSEVGDGEVAIEGQAYAVGESNAKELVGYQVECYYFYPENAAARKILYVVPDEQNRITEVDCDDITEVTNETFSYNQDGRNRSVDIPKAAVLIYNGGLKSLTEEALWPELGTVTLIDNDGNGRIDVIRVMDYRTIQVSGKSSSSYNITDRLTGEIIELNPNVSEYDVVLYIDGEPGSFENIQTDYIISYAASEGLKKNIKYIQISSKTVSGTLQTLFEDRVEIDGKTYPIRTALWESLSVGEEGEFFLDFMGRIVAKKGEPDLVYGYLNKIAMENFGTVRAQIFTQNDRWVVLEIGNKFRFNGASGYSAENFYQHCVNELGDYRQLITYTVNAEGVINRIDFAQSFEAYSAEEEEAIDSNVFRLSYSSSSEYYRNALASLGNGVLLTGDTKIFVIPSQEAGAKVDLDKFYIMSRSEMESDRQYSNISAYDLDRSRYAQAIVLEGSANESVPAKSSDIMVVQDVYQSINDEGIIMDSIDGIYKGVALSLDLSEDFLATYPTLSKGDAVQFAFNSSGLVSSIKFGLDYTPGEEVPEVLDGSLYATRTLISGSVHYVDYANRKIVLNKGGSKVVMGMNSNARVYIYDRDKEEVYIGEVADIELGEMIFARMRYYMAYDIVVYR